MKLKRPQDVDALLAKPAASLSTILLFGPDTGLVRERGSRAIATLIGDPPNPFGLVELNEADLRAVPSRLHDEWAAISFGSGRKAVHIRNGGEWLVKPLTDVLGETIEGGLIVIEAGELGSRSRLRTLCEAQDNAVAIGCYSDTAEDIARLVRDMMKTENLSIAPDVVANLTARLGSDRQLTRREVEKLALYVGPHVGPAEKGKTRAVTLDDVDAIVGDADALAVDDVVDAALGGDSKRLERALNRALGSGQTPVGIMLAVSRQLIRLHLIGAQAQAGQNLEQVIKTLRPPVHFKREADLKRQCHLWPPHKAADWLCRIAETDAMLRAPGIHAPDNALCSRALFALAGAAKR